MSTRWVKTPSFLVTAPLFQGTTSCVFCFAQTSAARVKRPSDIGDLGTWAGRALLITPRPVWDLGTYLRPFPKHTMTLKEMFVFSIPYIKVPCVDHNVVIGSTVQQ